MDDISARLYSAEQVRELDRRAITAGTPGYDLMQAAARACWKEVRWRWPDTRRIHVFCGSGNNGGDGYEFARIAQANGCEVRCWQVGPPSAIGDARTARDTWIDYEGHAQPWDASINLSYGDLIIDAIFGTGLRRPLEGAERGAVETINASGLPVLAVDIPSGLNADTGEVMGVAVRAHATVTFIGRKLGLYRGAGPAHAGEIAFDALEVDASLHEGLAPVCRLMQREQLKAWLPPRAHDAHKGRHGRVLILGGERGTMGAALLAARGALRGGAGLVSVATRAEHAALMTAAQPELMCSGVETTAQLLPLLDAADVVVAGPGMGQDSWGRAMLSCVIERKLPLVMDADALNLLAQEPVKCDNWVLTPHPGEAARLLGISNAQVQQDRVGAAQALREKFGGVVVLKGAGSLVQGESLQLCPFGNPGMAVGGMGDVLAGLIGALAGQGLALENAAAAGVLAHALAGDSAARDGERGLLPSDLINTLRRTLNV